MLPNSSCTGHFCSLRLPFQTNFNSTSLFSKNRIIGSSSRGKVNFLYIVGCQLLSGLENPSHYFPSKNHSTVTPASQHFKSNWSDGISTIDLKTCAAELIPALWCLFPLSFQKGIFPESCKSTNVQLLPKKVQIPCRKLLPYFSNN